ncbi:MAG: hypothetical protein GX039_01545 [Clostridia bacterium]|nr:hypothetical protein [Clostridia bacterium]
MEGLIIGAILLVAGAYCGIFLRKGILNKNRKMQYMETTTVGELTKLLNEYAAAGLEGYREYVELKGLAGAETPPETPYSKQKVAYYETELYQVYEERETYTDDKGNRRQRVHRHEEKISSQKSYVPILLKDPQTGETASIELTEGGMQLDTIKNFDKFEPLNMMEQYSFFSNFTFRPMGARTLGFRMVERIIPLEHRLYVLGEAYLENGRVYVGKPLDSKKPFIVSVKGEAELLQENKFAANLALVGGILLVVIGVCVMLFV